MKKYFDYEKYKNSKKHFFTYDGTKRYFGEEVSEKMYNDDIGYINAPEKADVGNVKPTVDIENLTVNFPYGRFNPLEPTHYHMWKGFPTIEDVLAQFRVRELAIEPVAQYANLNDSNLENDESELFLNDKKKRLNINKVQYNNYTRNVLNPNVEIDINNINLDDLYFNGDCVKVYKVDNPKIENGFPTTDKGFLYVFNRYKVDRLVKFYIPNGGRMVTGPKHWFHSEKHYWIPRKMQRPYNNLFEGVHGYNIDAGLTYLGDNDTFYDRYKNSIKSVLKSYIENTYIDKSMLYENDTGPITSSGEVKNERSNVSDYGIYDERKKGSKEKVDLHSDKKLDIIKYTYERHLEKEAIFESAQDGKVYNGGFESIYDNMKYYGIDHLMDNTSIFIDDPDCVVQMYVTAKRTYVRSNNDAETIYRHTALKNNPYFSPVEGLIRDLPTEVDFGEHSRVRKFLNFKDDAFSYNYGTDFDEFRQNEDYPNGYEAEQEHFKDATKKSKLTQIINGKIPFITPNLNLVPNHTHFMDEDGNYTVIRPLFRNSNPADENHIDIPSNLWVPKGLIYTEFGFFRDDNTSNNDLSNSLDEYNEVWKLKNTNSLHTIKRNIRTNRVIPMNPKEEVENNAATISQLEKIEKIKITPDNFYEIRAKYNNPNGIWLTNKNSEEWIKHEWNPSKKRFEPVNSEFPLLSYTGEVMNGIDEVQTFNETKVAVLGGNNSAYNFNYKLLPFLYTDYKIPEGAITKSVALKTSYSVYGLKGNALMFSNRDIIKDKNMYLNLPKLPSVLEPKKSFLLEGKEITEYLNLVFKGMPDSTKKDKLGNPAVKVGVIHKNTYPISRKKSFNIDVFFPKDESQGYDNRDKWQWATFMEKVKKGYPYRDEVKDVIGKEHDMKWTKWTSFYYPNSDRHTPEKSDGWRHNIDFVYIDRVFSEIYKNDDEIIEKFKPRFKDYIPAGGNTLSYTEKSGNWVTKVFGTGEKGQVHRANRAHLGNNIYLDSYTGIYTRVNGKDYPLVRNNKPRLNKPNDGMTLGGPELRTFINQRIISDYGDLVKRINGIQRDKSKDMNGQAMQYWYKMTNEERQNMFAINKGEKQWKNLLNIEHNKLPNPNDFPEVTPSGVDVSVVSNYKNYMIREKMGLLNARNAIYLSPKTREWIQCIVTNNQGWKEVIIEVVRAVFDRYGNFVKWADIPQIKIPNYFVYIKDKNEENIVPILDNTGMNVVISFGNYPVVGVPNSTTAGNQIPKYLIRKVMYR